MTEARRRGTLAGERSRNSEPCATMPDFPAFNRDKALIFRIIHRDNVPWLLDHGLHCRNSDQRDAGYVAIGDTELIEKRRGRIVPMSPGGTLGDYIPFYFTPRSPMLQKILTGRGVRQRRPCDIVIITTSLRRLATAGMPFVFTDGHAYMRDTNFLNDLADLGRIDWDILQRSDYRRSEEDPGKMNRHQAEALVHKTMRLDDLGGLACHDDASKAMISRWVEERGVDVGVFKRSAWYSA